MAENFPNLITKCYVEDAGIQWGPSWIYIKRTIPKHILLKLLKTKKVGKNNNFESSQRKKTCHENKKYNYCWLFIRNNWGQKKMKWPFFKCWGWGVGRRVNPEFYIQGKYFLRKWTWNKVFFRKIFASRSAFEEMLKDVFILKVNNTKWQLEFIVRVKRTRHDPLSIRAGWLVCRCLSLLQPVANIRKIDIRTKVFPTPC